MRLAKRRLAVLLILLATATRVFGADDTTAKIDALVTVVNNLNLVEISVGADDGVKVGTLFNVFSSAGPRGSTTGANWRGRVNVIRVNSDRAVGRIVMQRTPIKKGDRLVTSLIKNANQDMEVMSVKFDSNGDVVEAASFLIQLFASVPLTIVPEHKTRSIFLRGNKETLKKVVEAAKLLDKSKAFVRNEQAQQPANAKSYRTAARAANSTALGGTRETYAAAEKDSARLANDYRRLSAGKNGSPQQLGSLKKQVAAAVRRAFEARQEMQRLEVNQYQQRLKLITARLRRRDAMREKIIDRRIDDLLHGELGWELDTKRSTQKAAPGTPNDSYYGGRVKTYKDGNRRGSYFGYGGAGKEKADQKSKTRNSQGQQANENKPPRRSAGNPAKTNNNVPSRGKQPAGRRSPNEAQAGSGRGRPQESAEQLMLAAAKLEHAASVVDGDTADSGDQLRKAAAAYGRIHQKFRSQAVGMYASLYQARCLLKLGRADEARNILDTLLGLEPETRTHRSLITEAHVLALGNNKQAIQSAKKWLAGNAAENKGPEWRRLEKAVLKAEAATKR